MDDKERFICKYCDQEITHDAKVCHRCGRFKNKFLNWVDFRFSIANFISICLVIVAFWQLSIAREQATLATQANTNAQVALKEVEKARADVIVISKSVLTIAEILPRTGGYGGGLTEADNAKVKKTLDNLKSKIREFGTLPQ